MKIYVLMFMFSVLFAYAAQRYPVKSAGAEGEMTYKLHPVFVILSALVTIIVAGFRGAIADTGAYIESYKKITWQIVTDLITGRTEGKSPGFRLIEWLFRQIFSDYTVWFTIIAAFCVFCLWRVFIRYSPSFALSVFLFYGTTSVSWMFNGIRQHIAVCAMFLMFPLLLDKGSRKKNLTSTVIFIALTFLLYTVHSSAVVALPIFLICKGRIFGRWKTLGLITFIFLSSFVGPFTDFLSDLFKDPSFGTVSEDIKVYDGANILRLVIAAVPIFLGLYRIRQLKSDNDPVLAFCFNMSLVNVAIWVPAVVISGNTFGRFAEYTIVFNLLLYPLIISRYYGGTTRKFLMIGLIVGFSIWFYYQFKVTWNWPYLSEILGNYY
ncbi:MAG: EpsG family protein [Clostridia bacterium]|nr:EpsG family protein [Clostridia bacterium]